MSLLSELEELQRCLEDTTDSESDTVLQHKEAGDAGNDLDTLLHSEYMSLAGISEEVARTQPDSVKENEKVEAQDVGAASVNSNPKEEDALIKSTQDEIESPSSKLTDIKESSCSAVDPKAIGVEILDSNSTEKITQSDSSAVDSKSTEVIAESDSGLNPKPMEIAVESTENVAKLDSSVNSEPVLPVLDVKSTESGSSVANPASDLKYEVNEELKKEHDAVKEEPVAGEMSKSSEVAKDCFVKIEHVFSMIDVDKRKSKPENASPVIKSPVARKRKLYTEPPCESDIVEVPKGGTSPEALLKLQNSNQLLKIRKPKSSPVRKRIHSEHSDSVPGAKRKKMSNGNIGSSLPVEVVVAPLGVKEPLMEQVAERLGKELLEARVVLKRLNIPIPEHLIGADISAAKLQDTLEEISKEIQDSLSSAALENVTAKKSNSSLDNVTAKKSNSSFDNLTAKKSNSSLDSVTAKKSNSLDVTVKKSNSSLGNMTAKKSNSSLDSVTAKKSNSSLDSVTAKKSSSLDVTAKKSNSSLGNMTAKKSNSSLDSVTAKKSRGKLKVLQVAPQKVKESRTLQKKAPTRQQKSDVLLKASITARIGPKKKKVFTKKIVANKLQTRRPVKNVTVKKINKITFRKQKPILKSKKVIKQNVKKNSAPTNEIKLKKVGRTQNTEKNIPTKRINFSPQRKIIPIKSHAVSPEKKTVIKKVASDLVSKKLVVQKGANIAVERKPVVKDTGNKKSATVTRRNVPQSTAKPARKQPELNDVKLSPGGRSRKKVADPHERIEQSKEKDEDNIGEDEWLVEYLIDEDIDLSAMKVSSSDDRQPISVPECDSSTDKKFKNCHRPASELNKMDVTAELKMAEMRKAIGDLERIADRSMLRLKAEERQVIYLSNKLHYYENDKHFKMLRRILSDAAPGPKQNTDALFIVDLLLSYCPDDDDVEDCNNAMSQSSGK